MDCKVLFIGHLILVLPGQAALTDFLHTGQVELQSYLLYGVVGAKKTNITAAALAKMRRLWSEEEGELKGLIIAVSFANNVWMWQ